MKPKWQRTMEEVHARHLQRLRDETAVLALMADGWTAGYAGQAPGLVEVLRQLERAACRLRKAVEHADGGVESEYVRECEENEESTCTGCGACNVRDAQ